MPQFLPSIGDQVQVKIDASHTNNTDMYWLATIKSKDELGKWEIEIIGVPVLRGTINIDQYKWSEKDGCWKMRSDAALTGKLSSKIT